MSQQGPPPMFYVAGPTSSLPAAYGGHSGPPGHLVNANQTRGRPQSDRQYAPPVVPQHPAFGAVQNGPSLPVYSYGPPQNHAPNYRPVSSSPRDPNPNTRVYHPSEAVQTLQHAMASENSVAGVGYGGRTTTLASPNDPNIFSVGVEYSGECLVN